VLPLLARDAAKTKGERIAPLSSELKPLSSFYLLCGLRSSVMSLVRVGVTPMMSMVAMMFLRSGWRGFCWCFWLSGQNGRYC